MITDQASGRPLAGAQVVIYALHQVATSDTAGAFRLASLPIGSHDIIVRLVGYEQRILADVHVSDAGGVRARVPLQASVMDGCPGFAAVRVHKPWWKW